MRIPPWRIVLMVLAIGVHTHASFSSQIGPLLQQAGLLLRLSPVQRSALLAFGDPFAEYIAFVRSTVPEEGIVALPPPESEPVLGHTGLMQYFLFPRRTTNCPRGQSQSDCLPILKGASVFVLHVGSFPAQETIDDLDKAYVPSDQGRGIYVPQSAYYGR